MLSQCSLADIETLVLLNKLIPCQFWCIYLAMSEAISCYMMTIVSDLRTQVHCTSKILSESHISAQ